MSKPKKIIFMDKDFTKARSVKILNKKDRAIWKIGQLKLDLPKNLDHKFRNIIVDELGIKKAIFANKKKK